MTVRQHARTLTASAVLLVASATFAGALSAQSQSPRPATPRPAAAAEAHEGEEHGIAWKALDTYHTVMAASWHPAKDRNDLAPFRARAAELVAAARALTTEPTPATCGGTARTADLEALLRASEEAARAAGTRSVPDEQVKAALKLTHDRFHTVEEACSPRAGAAKQ
ncbi:MAG: hypothetical protein IT355_07920 [Gemmatimonadaceae bacterium]|nr:hypothetical protein [Gemmatimonadaceae bacterium]